MYLSRIVRALPVLMTASALMAGQAGAQADWRAHLEWQMADQHECEVAFLTGVLEQEVNGKPVVFARVHCADQRSFDVSRTDAFADFKVTACEQERTC